MFESELGERYLRGKETCVLIIPRDIAEKCDIDNPDQVIIRASREGILIKRKESENAGALNTSREQMSLDFTRIRTGEGTNVAE